MKNKGNARLLAIMMAATGLLLLPAIAMQFTNEVQWGPVDFLVAGILLYGTAALCEWVLRRVVLLKYRVLLCLGILCALAVVWAELAVGIFGSPFAGS